MLATIHAAAQDIRHRRLTPVDLLDQCLSQIDRLESRVHAWVLVDREGARASAAVLTAEIRQGRWRGPLHGIPVGVKDIFDVYDWPTAAGSRLWSQSFARRDGTVVERLRQAGAVFLGKTVTTAFASFDPPPTRNPWDLSRTPGGSSSGSAAALACGMCLGALGSQTGGSITRPAAYCGVTGCKPTYGRVSVDGVVPLAPSMDHPGPLARCVRDLTLLLQAMAGPDPRDPGCSRRLVPNWLAALDNGGMPPRFGRLRGLFEDKAEPGVLALLERVTDVLRSQGATVVEVGLPAAFAEVPQRHRTVMAVEAAAYHGPRLTRHPEDYPPRIRDLLEEGLTCPAPEYTQCKRHQRELKAAMKACLDGVDVLLTPATTGPAPDAATTGDPLFNSPWSYTGQPTVAIPAGWSDEGLPLGIQLVGGAWQEAKVLRAAAWCEQALAVEQRTPAAQG
jgi:aspartyl-tRNA(Asn)/glutamyl-tRNA(Gln) amidotransferase subunit A